jgi:hypothetical protein
LEKVFTKSNGKFDENLYSKRVFFVSALNTLISREEHNREEDVAFSNFEKALEIFLQNDEKAHQVYKDDIAKIAVAAKETNNHIKLLQDAQQTSDADFETQINKVLRDIKTAKERVKSLESVFASTKTACNAVIEKELSKCITALKDGWPAKLDELNQESKFGAFDTLGVAGKKLWGTIRSLGNRVGAWWRGEDPDEILKKIDRETEEKITESIQPLIDDIIEYIKGGFDYAGSNIQSNIEKHAHTLAESIDAVKEDIAKISKDMKLNINVLEGATTETTVDTTKLIVAAILGDYSQMTTLASGEEADWGEFIGRAIKQLIVDIIGYAILGPWGFVIAEVVQLINGAENRQTQFYKSMFDKAILGTESQIEKTTAEWQNHISTNFKELKAGVVTPLNQKLQQLEETFNKLKNDRLNNANVFDTQIKMSKQILDDIMKEAEKPLNGILSGIMPYSVFVKMI